MRSARGRIDGAFRRLAPGKWLSCRTFRLRLDYRTCWILPGRLFNRGTMHEGIDLAAMLDDWHATRRVPRGFL